MYIFIRNKDLLFKSFCRIINPTTRIQSCSVPITKCWAEPHAANHALSPSQSDGQSRMQPIVLCPHHQVQGRAARAANHALSPSPSAGQGRTARAANHALSPSPRAGQNCTRSQSCSVPIIKCCAVLHMRSLNYCTILSARVNLLSYEINVHFLKY